MATMKMAHFSFYEELNIYLPHEASKICIKYSFTGGVSLKETLLSLGIPLEEIDLILVNQQSKGLIICYKTMTTSRYTRYLNYWIFQPSAN